MENIVEISYPKNIRFKCIKCAICCGNTETWTRHILMLEAEARRISEATLQPIRKFAKKTSRHEPYVYEIKKTRKEGKCIFLKNKLCTIYALRPLICRFYPFELKTTKNGKYTFSPTSECPGLGKGKHLREAYFRSLLNQLNLL